MQIRMMPAFRRVRVRPDQLRQHNPQNGLIRVDKHHFVRRSLELAHALQATRVHVGTSPFPEFTNGCSIGPAAAQHRTRGRLPSGTRTALLMRRQLQGSTIGSASF